MSHSLYVHSLDVFLFVFCDIVDNVKLHRVNKNYNIVEDIYGTHTLWNHFKANKKNVYTDFFFSIRIFYLTLCCCNGSKRAALLFELLFRCDYGCFGYLKLA